MAHRQTPITGLEQTVELFSSSISWPNTPYLYQSTFNELSSVSQYTFLSGYLSSVWTGINLGSTMYVSTITNPNAMIVGSNNTVGGVYTLTAGWDNSNFGSNAFVGGCNSYGIGTNILAYGTGVQATSTNAAAFGIGSVAGGVNSVAHGTSTMTLIGSNQHAHGNLSVADGTASHAEGWSTVVFSDFSHVEGSDTQIWSGIASHAEGTDTWISSFGVSHVEGLSTFVYGGIGSHAEGANTVADVGLSHAEGEAIILLGSTSHAEGFLNIVSSLTSSTGLALSNAGAANIHTEGMCNIIFTQYNHLESISSINLGWANHIDGIGHITTDVLGSIEGGYHLIESPLIFNVSSFIRTFSSIFSATRADRPDLPPVGNFNFSSIFYINSLNNHLQGTNHYVSSPTFTTHIEGFCNTVYANYNHIEGAYNNAVISFKVNTTTGSGFHVEGLSNGAGIPPNTGGPVAGTHIEGASNQYRANARWSVGGHLEGTGHFMFNVNEGKTMHAEGSNIYGVQFCGTGVVNTIHKEGVNNYTANSGKTIMFGVNHPNAGTAVMVGGLSNITNNNTDLTSATFGKYNSTISINGFTVGTYNLNNATNIGCQTALGHYGLYMSNHSVLGYGSVAIPHSTTNSFFSGLIPGSAQSYLLTLQTITSTTALAYSNFFYNYTQAGIFIRDRRNSNIQYNTYANQYGISYPGSNQITYINVVDVKLTGYQSRQSDSSGGLGFYSGDYCFAIYRDNTRNSNVCIADLVSLSTASTAIVSARSTIIKPSMEVNKLFNATQVNVQVFLSNTLVAAPQTAFYVLQVNTNNTLITNWMAHCEISQVMRP